MKAPVLGVATELYRCVSRTLQTNQGNNSWESIMECMQQKNIKDCTCTYSCSKRGMCCECVAYHRKAGEIPGLLLSKDGEKPTTAAWPIS